MCEEWRPVVGYEGRYEVSSEARVKSVRSGRVSTGSRTADGFLVVRLTGEDGRKRAHYLNRLVCTVFNGPPPSRTHVVTHLSGEKIDCRPQNLKWATRAQSVAYALTLGLPKYHFGTKNVNARLTDEAVIEMRRRSRDGATYTQLAREYGVSVQAAYRAVVGLSWRHIA